MSRIAILGATSQIASDLVVSLCEKRGYEFLLYARRPEAVTAWLSDKPAIQKRCMVAPLEEYGAQPHDAVIHSIGAGDPAKAITIDQSFIDTTLSFDTLALHYVRANPACRYLFLSSGAVYGGGFDEPVSAQTGYLNLGPKEYYAQAKRAAELRHRETPALPIIDIRIFNYFSRTQNLGARFFITDVARALKGGKVFSTLPGNMTRDYLHPSDFSRFVECLLAAPAANATVDCYSKAPIDKLALLEALKARFGLRCKLIPSAAPIVNATGLKPNYYSTNHAASGFGYEPRLTSVEGIIKEIAAIL